jgi:hypothetical protein
MLSEGYAPQHRLCVPAMGKLFDKQLELKSKQKNNLATDEHR